MTDTSNLTIEQLQRIIANHESGVQLTGVEVYRQLLTTMQREEMLKPFNQLTPAEAERLALLAEDMGEALQAIGKVLRHGYESYHPAHPEGPSNRQALTREVGDVYAAVCLMCKQGDLKHVEIAERVERKQEAMRQYLHEQSTTDKDTTL